MRASTAVLVKGFTIIPSESDVEAGIYIWSNSYNCLIMDNVIANFSEAVGYPRNMYGFRLDGTDCTIRGNTFVNDGLLVLYSHGNLVEYNTVNGKPLVYLEDASALSVNDAGQVILINCNGIQVENLELSSATVGLTLWRTNNTNVIGNNITSNYYGILQGYTSDNSIDRNHITNNMFGINLGYSYDNSFGGNNITANSYGMYLYDSANTIAGNEIRENFCGVYCYVSRSDRFYHNNFIDNTNQVYIYDSTSIWDNGCEGNYWSDYNGADTSTPKDGIGDTYLPWQGVDYYPLMNPYWNPSDINHDLKVDIEDFATAAEAYGSYTGHPKWNPHVDITGTTPLVADNQVDVRDIAIIGKNFGKTYP